MLRRFFSRVVHWGDDDVAEAWPLYLMLYLVMAMTYVMVLVDEPSVRQPGPLALFTALMLAHGVLHWFSPRLNADPGLSRRGLWTLAYVIVQGGIVFAMGHMTQLQGLIMGLYFALAGEMAGILWPDLRAIALTASFYVGLLILNIVGVWSFKALVQFSFVIGSLLVFVLVYVAAFIRQIEARERTQKLFQELELAHGQLQEYAAQVEELTISQERERMARELHDTLVQGVAGLILQLEAVDSHLESGNPDRAQAVVQQAMGRARTTLHEARRAIQALRSTALERASLIDALGREADQLAASTDIRTTFEVETGSPDLPPEAAQDILRIVQESLSNVARHARASHVHVRLARGDDGLEVVVQDNGVGFDPVQGLQRPGCFGLAGMQERAERIGGVLQVESERGEGTRVILSVEGKA